MISTTPAPSPRSTTPAADHLKTTSTRDKLDRAQLDTRKKNLTRNLDYSPVTPYDQTVRNTAHTYQETHNTMTTTHTNSAQTYSETIADELHALEIVTAGTPYGYDHDHPDYDDDDATAYRAALAELEMCHDQADDALAIYLNETALDLSILRDSTGRARIEILRTCGGPRCEITRDTHYDGEQLTVTTWDTPNTASVTVWAPMLAAYLDEIAEAHA